jgi:hypothetical protein
LLKRRQRRLAPRDNSRTQLSKRMFCNCPFDELVEAVTALLHIVISNTCGLRSVQVTEDPPIAGSISNTTRKSKRSAQIELHTTRY